MLGGEGSFIVVLILLWLVCSVHSNEWKIRALRIRSYRKHKQSVTRHVLTQHHAIRRKSRIWRKLLKKVDSAAP